jgi:flavin-binding protein dodecin
MPYTEQSLPFAGKTPRSRHCSYEAAVSAADTRAAKSARYLAWLQEVTQATDHGAAEHFQWPLSSICSIRNGLLDRGLVTAVGDCIGRYGKRVTIWAPRATAGGTSSG